MVSQVHVVLLAEADHHQTIHIPHGGKLQNLLGIPGLLHHHKLPARFDLIRQGVEGCGQESILQGVPLILFVVVDEHADDLRGVLRQKNSRHTGNILPLLQRELHPLHRFIRNFPGFPMDYIGHSSGTQPQFLRDVADSHTLLHNRAPVHSVLHRKGLPPG